MIAGVNTYEFSKLTTELTKIRQDLHEVGIVFFQNAPSDAQAFIEAASLFGKPSRDGSAESDGISRIVYHTIREREPGGRAYSKGPLFPHTDRSGSPLPPRLLMNAIIHDSAEGGASTFVLGKELIESIAASHPELFDLLTQEGVVAFRRKSTLITAPIIRFDERGHLHIRFRLDEGIYFSPSLARQFVLLEQIIDAIIYEHAFVAGEGYIVDNHRNLHGRRGFRGRREVWRVLINESI